MCDIRGVEPELDGTVIEQIAVVMRYFYIIIDAVKADGCIRITADRTCLRKRNTIVCTAVCSAAVIGRCRAGALTQSPVTVGTQSQQIRVVATWIIGGSWRIVGRGCFKRAYIRCDTVVQASRYTVHVRLTGPEINACIDGRVYRFSQHEITRRSVHIEWIGVDVGCIDGEVCLSTEIGRAGDRIRNQIIRFIADRTAGNPDAVAGTAGNDVVANDRIGPFDRNAVTRRAMDRIMVERLVGADNDLVKGESGAVAVDHVAGNLRPADKAEDTRGHILGHGIAQDLVSSTCTAGFDASKRVVCNQVAFVGIQASDLVG